jgi:hypothetical protein
MKLTHNENPEDYIKIMDLKDSTAYENYLYKRWPDLKDKGSELSKQVEETIEDLCIKNHPLNILLAIGVLVAEQLHGIQGGS